MSNQQDREMTEDKVIDMQAQQCMELYKKLAELLEGNNAFVCITVLNRALIQSAQFAGYEPQQIVNMFLNTVAEAYELDKKVKEKTQ